MLSKERTFGRPTSKDVARVAGVSQSTVSYVLSGSRPISSSTRKKVLDAIEDLGFQPNARGRALVTRKTGVIGLLVPNRAGVDPSGRFPFIDQVSQTALSHGYDLLLVTGDQAEGEVSRLIGESRCDGLIVMEVLNDDPRAVAIRDLGCPAVLIGLPREATGLTCVDLDYAAAGLMSVSEAAQVGAEHIAVLHLCSGEEANEVNYVARFVGAVQDCAGANNIDVTLHCITSPDRDDIQVGVNSALQQTRGRNSVIVTLNIAEVQQVLNVLKKAKHIPGESISVLAVCSDTVAETCEPPVTNISHEPRDVSKQAVDLLVAQLSPESPDSLSSSPSVFLHKPHLTRRISLVKDGGGSSPRPTRYRAGEGGVES